MVLDAGDPSTIAQVSRLQATAVIEHLRHETLSPDEAVSLSDVALSVAWQGSDAATIVDAISAAVQAGNPKVRRSQPDATSLGLREAKHLGHDT